MLLADLSQRLQQVELGLFPLPPGTQSVPENWPAELPLLKNLQQGLGVLLLQKPFREKGTEASYRLGERDG